MTFPSDHQSAGFNVLTEEQAKAIVVATLTVMGDATEAHLLQVLRHVDDALLEHGLIENVLLGHAAIVGFAPDGEPLFSMTPAGNASVERLLAEVAPDLLNRDR